MSARDLYDFIVSDSYESGSYDSGSYDSGSYDSDSYDSGSYESDSYESNEEEYQVEKIVKQKGNKFLVKWVGHDEMTWEPIENLQNAPEKLADFFSKKSKKTPKRVSIPKRTKRSKRTPKPFDKNAAYKKARREHQEMCHPSGGFLSGTYANYDPGYYDKGFF
jgi:hypothetical protein